jgi:hypothetical protein
MAIGVSAKEIQLAMRREELCEGRSYAKDLTHARRIAVHALMPLSRMPLILSHIPPLQVRMGWQRVMRPPQTTLQTLPLQTLPLPHARRAVSSVAEAGEAFDCLSSSLVLLRHRMSRGAQPRSTPLSSAPHASTN